jgi:hypothetical protein
VGTDRQWCGGCGFPYFLDNVWIAIYVVCSWQMQDVVRFVVMFNSNRLLFIVASVVRLLPSFICWFVAVI